MSLWWTKKEQLDEHQLALIEQSDLAQNHLVTGPPGSGKTNVLLRRAQFVRSQDVSNILVLTFTRPLTEFIKTGCYDDQAREIFPQSLVMTIESWVRYLYRTHRTSLPSSSMDFIERKRAMAKHACGFRSHGILPRYQAILVDESQDLYEEEIQLLDTWAETLFYVGDDRQRIHESSAGLSAIREMIPQSNDRSLPFHYRLAPKICHVADQILLADGSVRLSDNCHYSGPRPETISMDGRVDAAEQLLRCATKLKAQLRVYQDLIRQGDRLGVIVAKTARRDEVFRYFESIPELVGKSQIVKSKDEGDSGSPSISPNAQIYIVTLKGCKGLEFRSAHWLFCNELSPYHAPEHYYTVVTRAKTDLDIMATTDLPIELLRAHSSPTLSTW